MSRAKPARKPRRPAAAVLPDSALRKLEVVEIRLHRATDVLTAIDYCANNGSEVNLGALAIATRDLVDRVLDDLAPFGRGIVKAGAP